MSIVACFVDCDCVADSLVDSSAVGGGDFSCCYFDYSTIFYEHAD